MIKLSAIVLELPFHQWSCCGYRVSPGSGADAPGGDIDCYKVSPINWEARSRQATGVNPVPTLFEMMRHFSFS